jgi:hypothetical protein
MQAARSRKVQMLLLQRRFQVQLRQVADVANEHQTEHSASTKTSQE